jgi:hypothetical protein
MAMQLHVCTCAVFALEAGKCSVWILSGEPYTAQHCQLFSQAELMPFYKEKYQVIYESLHSCNFSMNRVKVFFSNLQGAYFFPFSQNLSMKAVSCSCLSQSIAFRTSLDLANTAELGVTEFTLFLFYYSALNKKAWAVS